jgi:hypothetical protein
MIRYYLESSSESIEVLPSDSLAIGEGMLIIKNRTAKGLSFENKKYTYSFIELPLDMITNQTAFRINNLWHYQTPIKFIIADDAPMTGPYLTFQSINYYSRGYFPFNYISRWYSTSKEYDCLIVNDELPIREMTPPYNNRYSGTLKLEAYL